jgi:hypothetical protein
MEEIPAEEACTMSLQDFLKAAKQGQIVWFLTSGCLIRGNFLKYDASSEFLTINQVAIFQGPQATSSVATMSVTVSAILAWG